MREGLGISKGLSKPMVCQTYGLHAGLAIFLFWHRTSREMGPNLEKKEVFVDKLGSDFFP